MINFALVTAMALAAVAAVAAVAAADSPSLSQADGGRALLISKEMSNFERLDLEEPLNWVPAQHNQVRDMYKASLDKYDADSWARYVLEKCCEEATCTSIATHTSEFLTAGCMRLKPSIGS